MRKNKAAAQKQKEEEERGKKEAEEKYKKETEEKDKKEAEEKDKKEKAEKELKDKDNGKNKKEAEDMDKKKDEDKKEEETTKKPATPILAVSPTTLTFDTPTELQTKQLEIVNDSDERMAIKIKSSDAPNFRVDPVFWILEPRSKHTIQIARLVCPAKKDLLEVVSAKVTEDVGTESAQIQAVFKTVDKEKQGIVQVPIQIT